MRFSQVWPVTSMPYKPTPLTQKMIDALKAAIEAEKAKLLAELSQAAEPQLSAIRKEIEARESLLERLNRSRRLIERAAASDGRRATAAGFFWEPQSGIVMSSGTPSRDISNSALWWGAAAFTAAVRSAKDLTGAPSTESNTSPSIIPAMAPAPPATTLWTIRPRSESDIERRRRSRRNGKEHDAEA